MKSALLLTLAFHICFAQSQVLTRHVFIVTTDGFRWKEVFDGADSSLAATDENPAALGWWRPEAAQRRKELLPFFWTVLESEGQLYGNRNYGNEVNVRNHFKISYPGYNEILTGFADPVFIPNLRIRNWNRSVLAKCNDQLQYHGKVAAFTTWSLFPYILNQKRDSLVLNPACAEALTAGDNPDRVTFCNAMSYVQKSKPDLVFISFGETDHVAHGHHYAKYLARAHDVDDMVAKLWQYLQSDPYYKDQTTLIITTDHGRGNGKKWYTHGPMSKGSGDSWMAMIGPDTAPLGEIKTSGKIYPAQIACSVARLLSFPFDATRFKNRQTLTAFDHPPMLMPNPVVASK